MLEDLWSFWCAEHDSAVCVIVGTWRWSPPPLSCLSLQRPGVSLVSPVWLCATTTGDGPVPPPAPEAPMPSPDYEWDEHGRKVLRDGDGRADTKEPGPGFDFGFLSADVDGGVEAEEKGAAAPLSAAEKVGATGVATSAKLAATAAPGPWVLG